MALNATTGKLAWSYQTVHHDLWDMDMPSQPTLADIEVNGKTVPVIYAPAKTGNIFVLDRRNGELVRHYVRPAGVPRDLPPAAL